MRKTAFVLVVAFIGATLISCDKKSDADRLPGEIHPEYVGFWANDTTTTIGSNGGIPNNFEFDIKSQGATITANNNTFVNWEYGTWELTGDSLKFTDAVGTAAVPTFGTKVMYVPAGDTMVLQFVHDPITYTYHLRKE